LGVDATQWAVCQKIKPQGYRNQKEGKEGRVFGIDEGVTPKQGLGGVEDGGAEGGRSLSQRLASE